MVQQKDENGMLKNVIGLICRIGLISPIRLI